MNAESAQPGQPAPHRRLSRLVLLGAALLLAGPSPAAQTATPAAPSTPAQRRAINTVAPLTAAELKTLQTLFTKVRPATLRIEQCPPNDCKEPDGVGSGVLISADGLALTAYHVIEKAKSLSAQTVDRKRYKVEVVGFDQQNDIALLRVAVPSGTPFLTLAGARPSIGDTALAVGNGNGAFLQLKTGRLTGLDSDAGRADFPPGTLELNAPLIPGDSGGPIVNARGELTGVVSYISLSASARSPRDYRAYAVPVTASDARLADLKAGTKRDAPVIGIGLSPVFNGAFTLSAEDFASLSEILKLGKTPGAFFTNVTKDSPAAKAGLIPLKLNENSERIAGDIVTEVNGKRIVNFSEFQYAVRALKVGDTVTLTVLRDGKTLKIPVTLTGSTKIGN
ncbi:S1C family serine protease [Deinococcus koreensis]|uniref:Serine protease n=1 Tax=Deinococcus koreensis TaxID=2054903 RepID=A0A2K3UZS7_9DEIO|nr:trypsin-like peptidase domain-containing protein [Deinococcus koreensis]PNY82037.1 serine protease [Deinococcus koreensis]